MTENKKIKILSSTPQQQILYSQREENLKNYLDLLLGEKNL